MPVAEFTVEATLPGTLARAGRLVLPHGVVETPVFMPVGTKATVKALDPADLEALGAQIILGNAYHLALRPGAELVDELGGLHGFARWEKPWLTDSGGFQVFSLGFGMEHGVGKIAPMFPEEGGPVRGGPPQVAAGDRLCKVDQDGVTFRSHIDGTVWRFTPEVSIAIQRQLGADVILAFDECTSPLHDHAYTQAALGRTHAWAARSLAAHRETFRPERPQALFGIVQGGCYDDLRIESAGYIDSLGFDGYAIGGSLGNTKADMHQILETVCPRLDVNKPRHLLGIGEPEEQIAPNARGADMFDCVAPTRVARHGALFTPDGKFNIKNARFGRDPRPMVEGCGCTTCQRFSRAYLRHLYMADELLFDRLASVHNLYFIVHLVKRIRASILDGSFHGFAAAFLERYAAKQVQ